MATYEKGLARRASLTEGSARAAKSYKAKVASPTSERADLQTLIRELTEELVKHRFDLKHALVAWARAEDKEKEAWKDTKVTEDELRLAREELQAVKGDLWAKMAALERARQVALEAGNSVECMTEELSRLQMDLARQEALASRRGEVITELKDEACTQWASGWLAFQRRASRAFLDLEFTSSFLMRRLKDLLPRMRLMRAPRCFQGPLIVLPFLAILEFLRGLALLLSLLGLRLLTPLLPQVGAQRQVFRLSVFFFFFFCILAQSLGFCIASDFDYLLIYQDSSINFFTLFPISSI